MFLRLRDFVNRVGVKGIEGEDTLLLLPLNRMVVFEGSKVDPDNLGSRKIWCGEEDIIDCYNKKSLKKKISRLCLYIQQISFLFNDDFLIQLGTE